MQAPSFTTFGNIIRKQLTDSIEQIFMDINAYIFEKDHVDLEHAYIDGTKYRGKRKPQYLDMEKILYNEPGKRCSKDIAPDDTINQEVLGYLGVKLEKREAYAIDYVSELLERYKKATNLDESTFVSGCGHRKSIQQKQYQEMQGYLERLKTYARHYKSVGMKETVI